MGVGGGIQTGEPMTKVKREDVQPSVHFQVSHELTDRPEPTPLAKKVMENEMARYLRHQHKANRLSWVDRKKRGVPQDIQNSGKNSGSGA